MKKKVKRVLIFALALLLQISMFGGLEETVVKASPDDALYEVYGDFEYTTADGKVTIVNYIGSDETAVFPSEIEGMPVTKIGSFVFFLSKPTEVVIPLSVVAIDENAFTFCDDLALLSVDAGNEHFSSEANVLFNKGKSKLIFCVPGKSGAYVIPESVKTIGDRAFADCRKLTEITISSGVEAIGDGAFSYCKGLLEITIPASVEIIGVGAFSRCDNLAALSVEVGNRNYASKDNVLFNKSKTLLLYCVPGKSGVYIVPAGVKEISGEAFANCDKLTEAHVSSDVTTIGDRAFTGCSSLVKVTISSDLETIGEGVFYYCESLTNISVDAENRHFLSEDNVLFNKSKTLLIVCAAGKSGIYTIPAGVKIIGEYAFFDCTKLTEINIPSGVTTIGNSAFSKCDSLTKMIIPPGVTTIGEWAFAICGSLTEITLPPGITAINDCTFYFCGSLKEINIPQGVTVIGSSAFYSCGSLKDIVIPAGVTAIEDWAFSECSSLEKAVFEGAAPERFGMDVFQDTSSSFTIYYKEGQAGWTTPTWNGYKTEILFNETQTSSPSATPQITETAQPTNTTQPSATGNTTPGPTQTPTTKPPTVKAEKITLNRKKVTLKLKGKKSFSLEAKVLPKNTSVEHKKVSWSSDKKRVAVVSQKGKITAKKAGKCKITVFTKKNKKIKAVCRVIVKTRR